MELAQSKLGNFWSQTYFRLSFFGGFPRHSPNGCSWYDLRFVPTSQKPDVCRAYMINTLHLAFLIDVSMKFSFTEVKSTYKWICIYTDTLNKTLTVRTWQHGISQKGNLFSTMHFQGLCHVSFREGIYTVYFLNLPPMSLLAGGFFGEGSRDLRQDQEMFGV